MPELPEVAALADFLDGRIAALPIRRVDLASLSVLKTAQPPYTALTGRTVTTVTRIGKYLVITTVPGPEPPPDAPPELSLVLHLSRAGWIQWRDALPLAPPRPGGKGPVALRVHCGIPAAGSGSGEGFDVTEAGTRKRLAAWVVTDPQQIEQIAALGPDALAVDEESFRAILAGHNSRLKTLLTDQRLLAGIGNAYSDEILHTAGLSPFALGPALSDDDAASLYAAMRTVLTAALARLDGVGAAGLKSEKRTGLAVHGRAGLPCPVCGDTVREVVYAEKSFQYCPTCQTGGAVLADRRMSRLLK
ncbi:DNA-formamidopyrimidine glycosylase family protein [Gordonia sp. VNK21]|uniref:DNA-formamidopyrimidine glycosylase family protein n=1 Tax=Gordonia sp. VNK21 TaxID=3382483 RepID=UPI0038D4EC55